MITVEAIIIEDNLMAWVEGSLDNVIIERYRIKRYGSTIATIKSNDDTLRYQLKEEGIYVVMVTMRYNGELIERYTWPVSYFTETTKKEFDGFLKLDIDNEEELCKTLPLYKMRYPFSYIALVFNKNNKDNLIFLFELLLLLFILSSWIDDILLSIFTVLSIVLYLELLPTL